MQVFADAFAGFKKFKWQNKPIVAWLYSIANNHLYDFQKAKAKSSTVELDINLAKDDEDIASRVTYDTQSKSMLKCLAKLSPLYQQVIVLKLQQEMSFKEIAAIVGKKEATCRVIAYRALKELRRLALEGGIHYER